MASALALALQEHHRSIISSSLLSETYTHTFFPLVGRHTMSVGLACVIVYSSGYSTPLHPK